MIAVFYRTLYMIWYTWYNVRGYLRSHVLVSVKKKRKKNLSVSLSLSFFFIVSLSLYVSLSLSFFFCLSLSLSLFLFVSLSVFIFFSPSFYLCLFHIRQSSCVCSHPRSLSLIFFSCQPWLWPFIYFFYLRVRLSKTLSVFAAEFHLNHRPRLLVTSLQRVLGLTSPCLSDVIAAVPGCVGDLIDTSRRCDSGGELVGKSISKVYFIVHLRPPRLYVISHN